MNWHKQRQHVLDRIAYIPGGTDRDGNVLLVISTAAIQEVSYEQLVSLLALLSDTLPPTTTFTVIIDTRHIQLKQLKFYLRACQQALYKKVRQVLIIQPEKFLDQQKINFDLIVSGYSLRTILISMHKLSKFIDISQLPEEFGGTSTYDPDDWYKRRMQMTQFEDYLTEIASDRSKRDAEKEAKLDEFITKLLTMKRIDDKYAAENLKNSINGIKQKEEQESKEELIEEHAAGVNRLLDWLEGSGEKWLNSLCQYSDNLDEAESLVKQHAQLKEKTKEIGEQTGQLAEMATRLMAVCPQYSISLHKMREQVGLVGDQFAHRVNAQSEFAVSNKNFQAKLLELTRQNDAMLEMLCADDGESSKLNDLDEIQKEKKILDDKLSSLNLTFENAMEAGRETMRKAHQFEDVLPSEQFASRVASSLSYISQRQNRCNDLANVRRLKQQQLIQLLTTYADLDQAIKWLVELKETLNTEYSLAEVDENAVSHLRQDRAALDNTAKSTYDYGKQLVAMARTTERTTMRENEHDERNGKLEKAWAELEEAIRKNEARLRVVESFMATHRQMLDRVAEVEKCIRERIRAGQKPTAITMSVERRRLQDDIEELGSIGKMLSAQINADHSTSPENRQTVIKQIDAKVQEVVSAQRKMESLVAEEEDVDSSSGKESRRTRSRPLSKVAEEDDDTTSTMPRAVRMVENLAGITPAIRLSKNESYL
ncbi:unnamed protein product [Caenorhabditis bovis]|uniref:CRAL-TRIO domain-containing protein n=1 Tax=Caenorhabditis bovis TaxID=2654633 RepID=A0A8S1F938_9PELO|nr:unnamed protein product [Caenorhabditis bovis]